MEAYLIIGLQFLVVGVTLVGMWRLLKERDYFHDTEIKRHQ